MPIVSPSVYMTPDNKYSKLSNGAWRLTAIAEVIMLEPIQTICRSSSKDGIYGYLIFLTDLRLVGEIISCQFDEPNKCQQSDTYC